MLSDTLECKWQEEAGIVVRNAAVLVRVKSSKQDAEQDDQG